MPHIVLKDQNGNVIGYEEHGPEGRTAEDADEHTTIIINLDAVAAGLKGKKEKSSVE